MRYRLRTLLTQFSLRDLLWLISLIACNLGWYNSKVRPVRLLQDQIGNQQWEIAFHKKQVAIEREATKRSYDYLTDSRLREHRLKAENKSLKEQMQVNGPPREPDPKEALYGDWEIVEMVYRGKPQTFGERSGGWFRIGRNTFSRLFTDGLDEIQPLADNCLIRSREIDIWPVEVAGDKQLKGIHELKDGKLKIIWCDGSSNERPKNFDALHSPDLTLFVLKKAR